MNGEREGASGTGVVDRDLDPSSEDREILRDYFISQDSLAFVFSVFLAPECCGSRAAEL